MFLSLIVCELLLNMHLFLYKYITYNNNLFIQIVFIIQHYQVIMDQWISSLFQNYDHPYFLLLCQKATLLP